MRFYVCTQEFGDSHDQPRVAVVLVYIVMWVFATNTVELSPEPVQNKKYHSTSLNRGFKGPHRPDARLGMHIDIHTNTINVLKQ